VVLCVAATLVLAGCERGPSDAEIAARIAKSRPAWENYQEDIKGQIGAGPVAEWDGTPTRLWLDQDCVFLSFALKGPWATRAPGLPVLLRDPAGRVQQDLRVEHEGSTARYVFHRSKLEGIPAWIEIKYPHTERRLVLSESGEWRSR